jgi:hypothetical protein
MNERNRIALLMLEIWKLRNLTGEAERGRCPVCKELENQVTILNLCSTVGIVE